MASGLDFLQPVQCAYAHDLAVAASSFRDFMTALASAFRSVDHIAGLNLNYRKCCWVQYGSDGRESLLRWLSYNCEDFREMQVVRYGQVLWHQDWTGWPRSPLDGTPKKFIQRVLKINAPTKSLVDRLCDFKIYVVSVLSNIGSTCAPDKDTLKAEAHTFFIVLLQDHTMLYLPAC